MGKNLSSLGTTSVVKLKNVNKSFLVGSQKVQVLKNANAEISKGEFVVIFGPSGSGKSTMLHVMLGLERPDSGETMLMGLDMYDEVVDEDTKSRFRKQYIGMIYQQPNWIKSLDVLDNVAFPLILQGKSKSEAREKAFRYLSDVGMQEWQNYNPTELSSGQQQKVALARSLVNEPQILVADEPTGNLDYKSSQDLMELFRKIVDEGRTVVMVTHEIANLSFSDKVLRFMDGRVIGEIKAKNLTQEQIEKEVLSAKVEDVTEGTATQEPTQADSSENAAPNKRRLKKETPLIINYLIRSLLIFGLITIHTFFSLVKLLVSNRLAKKLGADRLLNGITKVEEVVKSKVEPLKFGAISKFYLVELSIQNMFAKRARTLVTIGGIAIGISFIVFLLSLGFGAEQLVIQRVARLEELRQFEAIPAVNSQVSITDETIARISEYENVNKVLPLIGVAGRISYNESAADTVVYGVQSSYLTESAIKPLVGEIFASDALTNTYIQEQSGESAEIVDETLEDQEVSQEIITEELVRQIEEDALTEVDPLVEKVSLPSRSDRQAVVNTVFLQVLGINQDVAVGQNFDLEMVITGNLTEDGEKLESETVQYSITAVIDEGDTPLVYVPLTDVREVGLEKYSLIKVAVASEDNLDFIRRQVELSGYRTSSVFDTVVQIESLFDNFRVVLIIVGTIALAVAALGMFNTLTVSLLERTREVGLMKAIGMKTSEVRDLFISESISMGFLGGISGLLIGYVFGKLLSLVLSVIAVSRGFSSLDVTYLPLDFLFTIILISGVVGMLTGFYPAQRATRISALNALRYE